VAGELTQILVDTSSRPRGRFYSAGALVDLDAAALPTVALTRPDGTAGPAAADIARVSQGVYDFRLVAADVADPTVYTVTWSGNIGGQPTTITTQVEAVGEFLFNLADLRDLKVGNGKPFGATAVPNFADEQLLEARTATLDEFEQILGFSPVPRFALEIHDGTGTGALQLSKRKAHRDGLLSVVVDGQDRPVDGYSLNSAGVLRPVAGGFPRGVANVAVEYVHGWERIEGDGGTVAMARAAMRLIPGLADAASSVTTPDGTSLSFDPAGQVTKAGTVRHFGVPAIDSWLNRWRMGTRARTLTYNPQAGSLFHGGRR
jgi:hypothetical protein